MPTVYALIPEPKSAYLDSAGDPASGAQLFIYTAGSSSKATTYTESDGNTSNANPIVLDSRGELPSGCYVESGTYKLVLAPSTDTDPPTSAIWTRDNVSPINDTSTTADQWTASGLTPTYVSASSFTVTGDQTSEFHAGRRVKCVGSATTYGVIASSAFTSLTTVTVTLDSGSLDVGLSSVSLGLLTATNTAAPHVVGKLTLSNAGTAGQVLRVSAGATAAEWVAGGWEVIERQTASASATIDFDGLDGSTYEAFRVTGTGVRPATDGQTLSILVGTGATPTYQSGASDYTYSGLVTTNTGNVQGFHSTGAAFMPVLGVTQGAGNATNESGVFTVHFANITNATHYQGFLVDATYIAASGETARSTSGGNYAAGTAITAVRLQMNSGNIAEGTFILEGRRSA